MSRWNSFKEFLFGDAKESATVSVRAISGGSGVVWPERGYQNFAKETYLKNSTAFTAIDEVAKSVASVPWEVFSHREDGGRDAVPEDPLNKVLKRANPQESFAFVMLKTTAYLVMCGNSFKERIRLESGPNKGEIRELYSHRPDRFTLKTEGGRLTKYVYTVGSNKTEWEVDPITGQSDILQLKTFHPLNDWWGAAPTESAAREIDTANAAVEWNKNLLDNRGRPGMVFSLVGTLGAQAFDDLERKLEARRGPANAGRDLIITGERGTTATPYGWSPADMDFSEGELRLMRKIARSYGVPPMLLGIPGEATFANYKEARLAFFETTIFWWLNYIKEELNNWFFPLDSEKFVDYILDDVPALSVKRDKLWERAEKAEYASINEKRDMVGLDSWGPAGDVILIEASKIPLGMNLEEEEEETEEETRQKLLRAGYEEYQIDEMLGLGDYDNEECEDKNIELPLEVLVEVYSAKVTSQEEKPYPNEFACRLNPPEKYDKFARVGCFRKYNSKCIDYIFGIKDGKSEVQALRYKKSVWSKEAARAHCKYRRGQFD